MKTTQKILTLSLACLSGAVSAHAQLEELELVVVTPHRGDRTLLEATSTVSLIDSVEIDVSFPQSLSEVVERVPGVNVAQNGAQGAASSIFLRGTESDHTLFVVDGIRVSDANTLYGNFLGGVLPGNTSQIEIVRGPHSVLYGADAIGGVIAINSIKGEGDLTYGLSGLFGSNETFGGSLNAQGAYDALSFSIAASAFSTDNERPNNAFDSDQLALRLDYAVSDEVTIGTTFRRFHQIYGSPNSRFVNDLDNEDSEEQFLTTVFAEATFSDTWSTRLTLGYQDQEFISIDPTFASETLLENKRFVIDLQNTVILEAHTLTFGYNGERADSLSTGFGSVDTDQDLHAVFVENLWDVTERFTLSTAVRADDFDSFGSEITWKAGAIWEAVEEKVFLRANVGTGFRAPSFLELTADSPFFVGNPDLEPEESLGWGLDIETFWLDGQLGARIGYFQNDLDNLIISDFSVFPSTSINIAEARTRGVELETRFRPVDQPHEFGMSYTWLEAEDTGSDLRLLRRPEHTTSVSYAYIGDVWGFDIKGRWIVGREDINAQTFLRIDGEDFLTFDAGLSYNYGENMTLRLAATNLLDESYESVHGFPALGRRVVGQVGFDF